MDLSVIIDCEILDEAQEVVMKDSFAHYLLSNTVNFETCAYILQKITEAIEQDRKKITQEEN